MIIKTDTFKDCCTKILKAIDSNELSTLTETLEIVTEGNTLYLNVTNKEYYASVKFGLGTPESFHATVNAFLFLKLIAQITVEDIELNIKDTYVEVKANGTYKIPLIFDNDKLLVLPKIIVNNPTVDMNVSGSVLQSIADYNSKELLKGTIAKPVQKMYYLDQKGCVTFTSGACVNNFELAQPIKVLLSDRLVSLFRLFKNDMVHFVLGHDMLSDSIMQTKLSLSTPEIELTAILTSDTSLIDSVPVDKIRERAAVANYPSSAVFSKDALLQTINRLLLFSAGFGGKQNIKPYSLLEFKQDGVVVWDADNQNFEHLTYANAPTLPVEGYNLKIDLTDFKAVLDTCAESDINLSFGNHQAIVVSRKNIYNVIPEVREN